MDKSSEINFVIKYQVLDQYGSQFFKTQADVEDTAIFNISQKRLLSKRCSKMALYLKIVILKYNLQAESLPKQAEKNKSPKMISVKMILMIKERKKKLKKFHIFVNAYLSGIYLTK